MAEVPKEMSSLTSVILQTHPFDDESLAGGGETCRSIGTESCMARHRVSVTFSLSAKQVELLDRLAQRTNVPKSVYVRKGVDVILRRYRGLLIKAGSTAEEDSGKP